MSKEITYKQCTLRRKDTIMVAWIPSKFARKNAFLRLKDAGEWRNGWQVTEIGSRIFTEDQTRIGKQEFKDHRKITDI